MCFSCVLETVKLISYICFNGDLFLGKLLVNKPFMEKENFSFLTDTQKFGPVTSYIVTQEY